MDADSFILTDWGREPLTPELALRFGTGTAPIGQSVAVAKACYRDQCWWQLLGPVSLVNRVEHGAARAAIELGLRLRAHLGQSTADVFVASSDVPAAVQGHAQNAGVRWVAKTLTRAALAQSLSQVTQVEAIPGCLQAASQLSQINGGVVKKLQESAHPLWHLPDAVAAALVVSVASPKKLRQKIQGLLQNARSGNYTAGRHAAALEAALALRQIHSLVVGGRHEELPFAVMADPAIWDEYAPLMAAAWNRLDAQRQALAQGASPRELSLDLVRSLDRPALVLLGAAPKASGWPRHPAADALAGPAADQIREVFGFDFLYANQYREARRSWRDLHQQIAAGHLSDVLDGLTRGGPLSSDGLLRMQFLGLASGYGVPRYPLTPEDAARVEAVRERLRQIEAETAARQADEARRAQRAREERQRQAQLEQERQTRQFNQARLDEIAALTPGRRSIAILKDEDYWRQRWGDLAPEWQTAAEALKARRAAQADARAVAKQAKEAEKLRQLAEEPVPSSRYLTIEEKEGYARVHFDPPQALTRGSRSLRQDACYVARSRLSRARFSRLGDGRDPVNDWTAETVEARVPRTEMAKLAQAVADIDQGLDQWQRKPLAPFHLEQILGITQTERYRWTKAGKFTIVGHDTFTKGRRTIEYPLFSRMQIFSLTPETIESWREADAARTAVRRKEGAKKAVESRVRNAALREDERMRIDAVAREAAREKGDLRFIALIKLGIYGQLASRWAKTYQVRRNGAESERFYGLKDQALRVIAASGEASIAFVPAEYPRMSVHLCDDHRDDWRMWRRELRDMTDFDEWLDLNRKEIKRCPACHYSEERHYYSLYQIGLEAGDLRLSFHVPYPIGHKYLPAHGTLPQLPDESDEGMFRYGRPVSEEEMLLHPAKEVAAEIASLLAFFQGGAALDAEAAPPADDHAPNAAPRPYL